MSAKPENRHARYHAHVYFDAGTLEQAQRLCRAAGEELGVAVGRVHTRPVGPHPCWSCQLAFEASNFDRVTRWLEENRAGLDILVHGVSGDNLADHTEHVSWLGRPHELNLAVFQDGDSNP